MNKQKTKAFTLVELIVVITILAILGTIAFIFLQGYSKSARDARRVSDINNIKTSLELFVLNTGKYPLPDNGETVSYSGEIIRTQGIVGDVVTKNLSKNLPKKPLDPLLETEYTYSVTNTKKEYEILSFFEGNITYNNILNTANAASKYTPKILGNYNGIFLKTSNYIIPTPSIISAEIEVGGIILNADNIKSQIITAGENFPNINNQTSTGKLDIVFSPTPLINNNSSESEKIATIEAIQNAYNGTTLANDSLYTYILSKTSNEDKIYLVESLVLNNTGKITINGSCGIDDGGSFTSEPTNLCSSGNASTITDNGEGSTYTWDCTGVNDGIVEYCSADHLTIIDGVCGADDGGEFLSEPTNLCDTGNASSVNDSGEGGSYTWDCIGENSLITDNCSADHLVSYIPPTNFTFFRVNEDHQNDYDADSVDNAVNYNGQSCIWKVYFTDTNGGGTNYDIIENGSTIMIVNSGTDCSGGVCRKIINKCSSSYDGASKTAYVVKEGITDTSGEPSSSFTNNCTSNGDGNDGWDNDCDRNFDENDCSTCSACNTCTWQSCSNQCISNVWRAIGSATYWAYYSDSSCQNFSNTVDGIPECSSSYSTNSACSNCVSTQTSRGCVTTGSTSKKAINFMGCTESCSEYGDVCNDVTSANCSACGSYNYSCNCLYK